MLAYQSEEAIEQNLRDAGCDEDCICEFMEDMDQNKEAAGMKVLRKHRSKLLDAMHREPKRIDCLDYLIYQMQKNKVKK